MTLRILLTADDYGMSDAVNDGIEGCLAVGAIKSTCVMANKPALERASGLRAAFPDASLGLHWNLTDGAPVLPADRVPTLVDGDGNLLPLGRLRRRLLRRELDTDEVRAELRAQYERATDYIGTPDFWNTHQHSHYFPVLLGLMTGVGLELGIPAMRNNRRMLLGQDVTAPRYYAKNPPHLVKDGLMAAETMLARRRGMAMPDGMLQMMGYGPSAARLVEAVADLPERFDGAAVECVVHPSTEAVATSVYSTSRVEEYETFSAPDIVDRLASAGVEAIGFRSLTNA